jgi:hypothetical protein
MKCSLTVRPGIAGRAVKKFSLSPVQVMFSSVKEPSPSIHEKVSLKK